MSGGCNRIGTVVDVPARKLARPAIQQRDDHGVCAGSAEGGGAIESERIVESAIACARKFVDYLAEVVGPIEHPISAAIPSRRLGGQHLPQSNSATTRTEIS